MTISKQMNGTTLTLAPEGRLDTMTSPELEKELNASLDGADTLMLDFSRLDYISSAGLRVLLIMCKTLPDMTRFHLENASKDILDILEVTGFADIFGM